MTPRIITCIEPLDTDELYLTVRTPEHIIHIYAHKTDTILSIKQAICDRFYAYPTDLDLFLETPYPIPSHTILGSFCLNELHFFVLNYSPIVRIPLKYVTMTSNRSIFYLNHVFATDLPYLSEWLCTDRFDVVEVDSEHPRIAEIIMMVATTLARPEITRVQTLSIRHIHMNINYTFLSSKILETVKQLLDGKGIAIVMKYDIPNPSVQTLLKNVPFKEIEVTSE